MREAKLTAELEQCRRERDEAVAKARAAEDTIERVFSAVQRYESYHDRDHKRIELWKEVKRAFVVPAAESAARECSCGVPSPDRLVVHRTDGPCYLRDEAGNRGEKRD